MKRAIGQTGRSLNPIGLGCMGLSGVYNAPVAPDAAVRLLHEAIDLGVEHFDTAEVYGLTKNEELLGAAFHDRRNKVFVATKWGPTFDVATGQRGPVDGSRANCRRAVEGSLKRLRTDVIDLYYLHRVDPKTPIEESVDAMAELVKEGKIRLIGLSEPSAVTIKRAALVAPIAAVQSEYSIFTRDVEDGRLAAMKTVGASLVAFSPVGRGMLTGKMTAADRPTGETDFRNATIPRFSEENFAANLKLVAEIEAIAEELAAKPAQVALAWVLARAPNIHVIPGTTRIGNLAINLGSDHVLLSQGQTRRLDALAEQVSGARYTPMGMSAVNR
ncbi:MAG: aldo/keto reductase [Alphaproteobacteria bacterium]|nr:aldo/keto reductase [Alphaproteobacteria bacterium]